MARAPVEQHRPVSEDKCQASSRLWSLDFIETQQILTVESRSNIVQRHKGAKKRINKRGVGGRGGREYKGECVQ